MLTMPLKWQLNGQPEIIRDIVQPGKTKLRNQSFQISSFLGKDCFGKIDYKEETR